MVTYRWLTLVILLVASGLFCLVTYAEEVKEPVPIVTIEELGTVDIEPEQKIGWLNHYASTAWNKGTTIISDVGHWYNSTVKVKYQTLLQEWYYENQEDVSPPSEEELVKQ